MAEETVKKKKKTKKNKKSTSKNTYSSFTAEQKKNSTKKTTKKRTTKKQNEQVQVDENQIELNNDVTAEQATTESSIVEAVKDRIIEAKEIEKVEEVTSEKPTQDETTTTEEKPEEVNLDTSTAVEVTEEKPQEEEKVVEKEATTDEEELDLSQVPSIVEKPKKKDKLSNTIQLKTTDDTLVLQREVDTDLLKKRFKLHIIDAIRDPYGMVERIDFYNFKNFWHSVLKLIFKWGISIIPFIIFLSGRLNDEAFSYARMTFTDKAWLWFRIMSLGVLTELCIYFVQSLIGFVCGKGFRFRLLVTAQSYISPTIIILYLISGLLTLYVDVRLGILMLVIAMVYSCNLHSHAYQVVSGFSKNVGIFITSIFFAVGIVALYYWFQFAGNDIMQIIRVFFNLT